MLKQLVQWWFNASGNVPWQYENMPLVRGERDYLPFFTGTVERDVLMTPGTFDRLGRLARYFALDAADLLANVLFLHAYGRYELEQFRCWIMRVMRSEGLPADAFPKNTNPRILSVTHEQGSSDAATTFVRVLLPERLSADLEELASFAGREFASYAGAVVERVIRGRRELSAVPLAEPLAHDVPEGGAAPRFERCAQGAGSDRRKTKLFKRFFGRMADIRPPVNETFIEADDISTELFEGEEVPVKIWFATRINEMLKSLAEFQATTVPRILRGTFFSHAYGRFALEQMRVTLSKRDVATTSGKDDAGTEEVLYCLRADPCHETPVGGKLLVSSKLFLPQSLVDDLQDLAKEAGLELSPYLRTVLTSSLLGEMRHLRRPKTTHRTWSQ